MRIEVIIPVYRPGEGLKELLRRLMHQHLMPDSIHLIHTLPDDNCPEKKTWQELSETQMWEKRIKEQFPLVKVTSIPKAFFDHGGTRRMAAAMSEAEIMVFMTQDAMPCDEDLLGNLTAALMHSRDTGAAYARQLPAGDCKIIERFYRGFNYPDQASRRSQQDTRKYGIRTYFCSDVCAAYKKEWYERAGGFPEKTIFNEDMILTGRMLQRGATVAYVPEAKVIHSHNYSCRQQFSRNFDLGVSQAQYPDVFAGFVSEGEGVSMVMGCAGYLLGRRRPDQILYLVLQTVCKYAGYRLGKAYRHLPAWLIRRCTFNPGYWQMKEKGE